MRHVHQLAGAVGVALTSLSCAFGTGAAPTRLDTGPVEVRVNNRSWSDAAIYLVSEGLTQRIGLATAGLLAMAGSHLGTGGLIAAAGVGLAFVPNMIGTAFDATSAAPLTGVVVPPMLTAWWAPATAALYPVLLALRLVQDPVWVAALTAAWLRPRRHARAAS